MTDPEFMIVTSTVASEEEAEKLATLIISQRLAACVQHFPIKSIYRWKGEIETGEEHLITAKTQTVKVSELISFIKENHSYDVPEIIATSINAGHKAYLDWIKEMTE